MSPPLRLFMLLILSLDAFLKCVNAISVWVFGRAGVCDWPRLQSECLSQLFGRLHGIARIGGACACTRRCGSRDAGRCKMGKVCMSPPRYETNTCIVSTAACRYILLQPKMIMWRHKEERFSSVISRAFLKSRPTTASPRRI